MHDDSLSRIPPHIPTLSVLKRKSQVIDVKHLISAQCDALVAECTDEKGPFFKIRKNRAGELTADNATKSPSAFNVVSAWKVQEVCYPISPEDDRVYFKHSDPTPFLLLDGLVHLHGLSNDASQNLDLHDCDVLHGSIEGSTSAQTLKSRLHPFPHIHQFVSISVAVQLCPESRVSLLRLVPNVPESFPELPKYSISECDGEWLSILDLEVSLVNRGVYLEAPDDDDGDSSDDPDICKALCAMRGVKQGQFTNAVRVPDDASLKRCTKATRASGRFVHMGWLAKITDIWTHVQDAIAPANPALPILIDTNPAKQRAKAIPKGAKICSVERTLSRRLVNEHKDTIHATLLRVCEMERRMAEFGTLLLNVHLLRLLDEGGGKLQDGVGPHAFDASILLRKCMAAVRFGRPKHPGLGETYDKYSDTFAPLVDTTLPETGNCIKYAATQLVANAYVSIKNHGKQRVHALLTSVRKVHGGESKQVNQAVAYIEGRGQRPSDAPGELLAICDKYFELYRQKGVHRYPAFDIYKHEKADQANAARRYFELFYEINRDMRVIEQQALDSGRWKSVSTTPDGSSDDETVDRGSQGDGTRGETETRGETVHREVGGVKFWKSYEFSLLPVTHLKSRCALIDGDIMRRACFRDVKALVPDLADIFDSKGAARSLKLGWRRSSMFRTNGTTLIEVWYLPKDKIPEGAGTPPKSDAPTRKAHDERVLTPGARKVGDDPGDVNKHYVCEVLPDESIQTYVFTRAECDEATSVQRKRRNHRQELFASQANGDFAVTRKKTADLQTFLQYVAVRVQHRSSLANAYASRAARADAFEEKRVRRSLLDTFINRVIGGGAQGQGVCKAGPDGTDKLHWGEGNRTRSAQLAKRLQTAFKEQVEHMWIDEGGSTKYDCVTGNELDFAWRHVTGKDGKTKWVKDRDVRFRKPEDVLGSRHPYPISPDSLRVKDGFQEEDLRTRQAVCRDGNAAYTIRCRTGVPRDQWHVPTGGGDTTPVEEM